MKRLLLICVLASLSLFSFAAGVKVKSGSTDCLKEDAKFVFEMDVTNATWMDNWNFVTWCGDNYDERMSLMQNAFVSSFNKNSKAAQMVENSAEAKYKMVMKFDNFKVLPNGFPGQMKAFGFANVVIVEVATGKTVCTIDVNNVGGGNDYVENDRLSSLMENIAKNITKLK